jgi:hypothetical protein
LDPFGALCGPLAIAFVLALRHEYPFAFAVLLVPALLSAPLVFLGGFWAALVGSALWELGMGVHESIVPADPTTWFPVFIEILEGAKIKYEWDKTTGLLWMNRILYSAVYYPANYRHPAAWPRHHEDAGQERAG